MCGSGSRSRSGGGGDQPKLCVCVCVLVCVGSTVDPNPGHIWRQKSKYARQINEIILTVSTDKTTKAREQQAFICPAQVQRNACYSRHTDDQSQSIISLVFKVLMSPFSKYLIAHLIFFSAIFHFSFSTLFPAVPFLSNHLDSRNAAYTFVSQR
jgi:hypothetical protein